MLFQIVLITMEDIEGHTVKLSRTAFFVEAGKIDNWYHHTVNAMHAILKSIVQVPSCNTWQY